MTQASWAKRRPEQTMYCEEDGLRAIAKALKSTSPRLLPIRRPVVEVSASCSPLQHPSLARQSVFACWRAVFTRRFLKALLTAAADTAAISRVDTSNTITYKGSQLQ
jgi:hypothetical protein